MKFKKQFTSKSTKLVKIRKRRILTLIKLLVFDGQNLLVAKLKKPVHELDVLLCF